MEQDTRLGSLSQERAEALRHLLDAPITSERLRRWGAGDPDRENFLATAFWGQIAWNKGLGRPNKPTLAGGFVIQHSHWIPKLAFGADGAWVDMSHWSNADDIVSWDLPEDTDHYRVGFMFRLFPFTNKITVSFAADRGWRSARLISGPRVIEPPERRVEAGDEPAGVDFEVVELILRPVKTP
jgi:hypothetical protein